MSAATMDRKTQVRAGMDFPALVAAGKKIWQGTMVVTNAAGFVEPASTSLTVAMLGVASETVDNTAGGNGAATVIVQRLRHFKFANFAADPISQAHFGKSAYIVDDQTVAATSGGGTRAIAGGIYGIEADGVWIRL